MRQFYVDIANIMASFVMNPKHFYIFEHGKIQIIQTIIPTNKLQGVVLGMNVVCKFNFKRLLCSIMCAVIILQMCF